MKRSMTTGLVSMLGLAALLTISGTSANADDTTKKSTASPKAANAVAHHLGKLHLQAEHVKTFEKKEIVYTPLKIGDLNIKNAAPDTKVKLADGTQITVSEYLSKANKYQEWFAKRGHALRGAKSEKILLHQTNVNHSELEEHAKRIHGVHRTFDPKAMHAVLNHDDLDKKHGASLVNDALRLKKLTDDVTASAPAKTFQTVKQWNYVLGNKNLVAAYLNGKVEVKGTKDDVTVSGDARAGGYLIKKEINLIKATGSVNAPAKGKSRATLHVYLLGQHVINIDKSGDASMKLADSKSHGIDVHAQFHFSIGPIPMTAKLGARGQAGVRYLLAVRPAHATMQVTPFVDARVYAQVGVDLGIASGGAGGEVTLLKDELTFGAELGVDFDSVKGPTLTEHVYAQNKMTMLSGKVYAWARVNYFIGSHEWHHDLFSWKGIQTSGYLFNVRNTNYLIPNYQAVAQKN